MTLLHGSAEGDVEAPIERCWEVVEAIEQGAQWQRGIESVQVIERDDDGRASICEIVADARFTKVRVRTRFSYERPRRLEFHGLDSPDIDHLEGSWELTPLGPDRTHVRYSLAVDPGVVGLMARPLERALRPIVVGQRPRELAAELARRAAAG